MTYQNDSLSIRQSWRHCSLRSKRFRRAFRPLEAFFAFWLRKNCGRAQHWWKHFFSPAPIFPRPKNEKCIERAESLTETLATQASDIVFCIFTVFGEIWFLIQQTSSTAEDKKKLMAEKGRKVHWLNKRRAPNKRWVYEAEFEINAPGVKSRKYCSSE